MKIDDETKALAALALSNAFYIEFSEMVNRYLAGAEGLDQPNFDYQLGDMTSIFCRADVGQGDEILGIWSSRRLTDNQNTCGHSTLREALTHGPARRVYLRGRLVFERKGGKWFFVGDRT